MTSYVSSAVHEPPAVSVLGTDTRFPVRRIYCVGRNYAEHSIEMGGSGREVPFFFMKPADAVLPVKASAIGHMHYPPLTNSLHHEVELVVAIGQGGRNIAASQALQHVFGYAVGLDMTRRDLQAAAKKEGRPWDIAKGFDESAPIGEITPADQFKLEAQTPISLTVNGTSRQSSELGKMIWSVPEIIEHVSRAWGLQAGDLIFTGTPEGVAAVVAGDALHARIAGLSELKIEVVA